MNVYLKAVNYLMSIGMYSISAEGREKIDQDARAYVKYQQMLKCEL